MEGYVDEVMGRGSVRWLRSMLMCSWSDGRGEENEKDGGTVGVEEREGDDGRESSAVGRLMVLKDVVILLVMVYVLAKRDGCAWEMWSVRLCNKQRN